MRARRARRLPTLSQQPGPPRTCVGLGDTRAGSGSRSRSRLCWLHLQCLGCWVLHLRLGLGQQGKREKTVRKGGVLTHVGTPREGPGDTPT